MVPGNDLVLTVPEPGTLALLVVLLAALFGWAWWRKHNAFSFMSYGGIVGKESVLSPSSSLCTP
jgi:hypothetical protein